MEKVEYIHSPISNLNSLSSHLGFELETLKKLAAKADSFYRQNKPKPKTNGDFRVTYRISPPLKKVQTAIKVKLFYNTVFPQYLQGSIKDTRQPRSPHTDAEIHLNARFLICTDVRNFYDSIDIKHVDFMWKHLFGFSPDVSALLSKLTTYQGHLLQGSPTSSYIANAIFWDIESHLVEDLNNSDILYSRYVDDITLSTMKYIDNEKLGEVVSKIYGMMIKKGIKPNRKKQEFKPSSCKMDIHNLNINSGKPTLGKEKINQIRLEVFNCKKHAEVFGRKSAEFRQSYTSVKQKVHRLQKYSNKAGTKYLRELEKIRPL